VPQQLLSCEELHDVPFLILGNKIDLGRAASEDELRVELGLHHLTTGKVGAVRDEHGGAHMWPADHL
jgi:GTPase SAR1 family protein